MDSQKPETRENASNKTLETSPLSSTAKSTPLPPNPNSAMSTPHFSSNPSAATKDETKKEGEEAKGEQKGGVALTSASIGAVTDLEKKMRRAERFGLAVVMSEEEKRNTRAERFGTGPVSVRTGCTGQLEEEQKRKARAERFGTNANAAVDEEVKKKARLERFSQGAKVDASEEEKRKARAMRFAQNSTSSSQSSAKNSSDLKEKAASVASTA